MAHVFFVSHPEVVVDPAIPVPRWHLSETGIARMRAFAARPALARLASVWASAETKAIEAAGLLAARHGLPVQVNAALHENDRSATGFLPPTEFEAVADAFFARPQESVRGWERAVDAQARIVSALAEVLARAPEGDVAIVAHGGVGTLLLCHCLGVPIDRALDQKRQGHVWALERGSARVLHRWRLLEEA